MPTTTQAEHPILFIGDMVRAILDGRKTQTRRVVTPRNSFFNGLPKTPGWMWKELDWTDAYVDEGPSPSGNPGPYFHVARPSDETRHRIYPRVQVGDLLWVREAFWRDEPYHAECLGIKYCATDDDPAENEFYPFEEWVKHPSIHMPKWVCRLWLEVTGVRAERVQDIAEEDARAEGITEKQANELCHDEWQYACAFGALWDSINEKRGHGWEVNPWVWVYEFKQVTKEVG